MSQEAFAKLRKRRGFCNFKVSYSVSGVWTTKKVAKQDGNSYPSDNKK